MRVTLTHRTPDDTIVWDSMVFVQRIGERVPCYVDGKPVGVMRIIAARVIENGHTAEVTYDGPQTLADVNPYHGPLWIRD